MSSWDGAYELEEALKIGAVKEKPPAVMEVFSTATLPLASSVAGYDRRRNRSSNSNKRGKDPEKKPFEWRSSLARTSPSLPPRHATASWGVITDDKIAQVENDEKAALAFEKTKKAIYIPPDDDDSDADSDYDPSDQEQFLLHEGRRNMIRIEKKREDFLLNQMKLNLEDPTDQKVYVAFKGLRLGSFEGYLSTWMQMKKMNLPISMEGYASFVANERLGRGTGKEYKSSTFSQKQAAVVFFEKVIGLHGPP